MTFSKGPGSQFLSIVGPMEGKGPYALDFDQILPMMYWVKKRRKDRATDAGDGHRKDLAARDQTGGSAVLIAGDLMNQIIVHLATRTYSAPYLGIYGACSTFAQALGLGAVLLQGDFAEQV